MPGRERTFFVNKELTNIDDMLAGVMRYVQGTARRPITTTRIASTSTSSWKDKAPWKREEGVRDVGPGDMVFIPAEAKHRLRATETPLFYFEFQAPNRFKSPHPGRHAGRPALEPRGRPRLGPNIGARLDQGEFMLTFIDTNKLPRVKTPQGEVTEILNRDCAARRMSWGRCAGSNPARNSKRIARTSTSSST